MIDAQGHFLVKDLLSVEIDLTSKELISAQLDDMPLSPEQAVILLWFYLISANHVKIHSMANWGVNVVDKQRLNNPIHYRSSIVTIFYNYLGYVAFSSLMPSFKRLGLLAIECGSAMVRLLTACPRARREIFLA